MIVWQQGEDYVLMYSNFFLFPRVLRHRRVSTNDEGLSLGQLMIAAAKLEK